MFKDMPWLNEPPQWEINNTILTVKKGNKTDFLRKTFYEFIRDDGHFIYKYIKGDFTMQVTFVGDYKARYDQAGLMIRVDEKNWIKSGIEFTDTEIHLSAVITREFRLVSTITS